MFNVYQKVYYETTSVSGSNGCVELVATPAGYVEEECYKEFINMGVVSNDGLNAEGV